MPRAGPNPRTGIFPPRLNQIPSAAAPPPIPNQIPPPIHSDAAPPATDSEQNDVYVDDAEEPSALDNMPPPTSKPEGEGEGDQDTSVTGEQQGEGDPVTSNLAAPAVLVPRATKKKRRSKNNKSYSKKQTIVPPRRSTRKRYRRCPNGERKRMRLNPTTNMRESMCVKKEDLKKRCPNGTRKNVMGECVELCRNRTGGPAPAEVAQMNNAIREKDNLIQTCKDRETALKNDLKELRKSSDNLETDLESCNQKLQTCASKETQNRKNIGILTAKNAELTSTNASLTATNAALTTTNAALTKENKKVNDENFVLKHNLNTLNKDLTHLGSELRELKGTTNEEENDNFGQAEVEDIVESTGQTGQSGQTGKKSGQVDLRNLYKTNSSAKKAGKSASKNSYIRS